MPTLRLKVAPLLYPESYRAVAGQRQLSLSRFYAGRALRTWPLFWLVLAAYYIFPSVIGGKPPPPLWQFLTLTQNY